MTVQEEQTLVRQAVAGSKEAVEKVVVYLQADLYNLSIRFLFDTEEGKDATQEILIRLITRLSTFEHKSRLKTWAWRIAKNYLINYKESRKTAQNGFSFEAFSAYLQQDSAQDAYAGPDGPLLELEVKLSCSTALLQCLSREQRIAYLLGELFELGSEEGAYVTDTRPENFRKRLSVARERIRGFMQDNCGIVNPDRACRCQKRIQAGLDSQRIKPGKLNFVGALSQEETVRQVEGLASLAALYHTQPKYQVPGALQDAVRALIASRKFDVLS
ncbi:MAG: RNA polymerase sigma factor [Bacteroidetes bacterium]|jgi:RNA polymerase sigma factor (sigma-70 family)|nr:RNA polymerase sigma factor [Bacteroidota bacterium]